MKRNIFVFSAILMVVFFSAFKLVGNEPAPKYDGLFWYVVKPNGVINHLQPVNGGAQTTRAYLEANQATLVPCPVSPGTDCIKGFNSPKTADDNSGKVDSFEKAN